MEIIKIILVFIVVYFFLSQMHPFIEKFYQQVSGKSFHQENLDNKYMYMCKDGNDLPFSCHGQGVTQAVYDKYSKYSGPCPKNWLLPGNSIY